MEPAGSADSRCT